jgi:hypothetical protein
VLALVALLIACVGLPSTASARPRAPLLVANVSNVSDDEQLLFTALQGLVNRRSPRVYYVGLRHGQDFTVDPTAEAWLRDAVPLQTKRVAPYRLLRRFRSKVRGLVVWDPDMAVDTQNVATTMAGHHHLLPASPQMADRLQRAPWRLRVRLDLRREDFRTREQAYEWALAHLNPHRRTLALAWLGGSRNGRVGQHGLRDLIVARRGFAFDANPQDDWALVLRILDAFPRITRVFGYPFFETDFYAHTGLAENESIGVGEISRAGKVLIPSTDSTNLTVHKHLRVAPRHPKWDDRPEAPDPAKTYVSFLVSDGDSLGHNQQVLRPRHWDNPARGSIPMGISISPWLSIFAPRIYDFYVRTLSPTDVLLAGPSGAGYFYPQFESQLDLHLEKTRRLMNYTGLRAVWILDNGYLASPSQLIVQQYVDALQPSAIFADYGGYVVPNPPALSFAGGVPVVHAMWVTGMDGTTERIGLAASTFPGQPAFVLVALQTGRMSYSDAREVMERLGPSYEAVRPDRFVGLIKGAYPGAAHP